MDYLQARLWSPAALYSAKSRLVCGSRSELMLLFAAVMYTLLLAMKVLSLESGSRLKLLGPDGSPTRYLASCSDDRTIRVWDLSAPVGETRLPGIRAEIECCGSRDWLPRK